MILCEHGHNTAKVYCLWCYRKIRDKLIKRKCAKCSYTRLAEWTGKEYLCKWCLKKSRQLTSTTGGSTRS